MNRKHALIPFSVLLLGIGAAAWWTGGPGRLVERNDLLQAQRAQGWLPVGEFGNHWPARIVDDVEGLGGIDFRRADGSDHTYRGFDGYRMRVLFLRDRKDRETIVVLRSAALGGRDPRIEREQPEPGVR